jgi:23S rRNA (cytosine1962-C5)-methyltransferase
LPALRLKRNEDRRLHAGHLWIFSNEVDTQQTPLPKFKPGELVRVLAHNDRALGLAYVNPKSLISARMLGTWKMPDTAWLAGRIRGALALARAAVSEALLPLGVRRVRRLAGLGGRSLWIRVRGANRHRRDGKAQAADSTGLERVLGCEALLFKNDGSTREMEGLPSYVESPRASSTAWAGLRGRSGISVPLVEGQKTGWFFDQAANRRALAKYVRKGARVLDVFSYVGAWGVRAAQRRARGAVRRQLRGRTRIGGEQCRNSMAPKSPRSEGDAFDVLEDLVKRREKFDIVIVDPPAFAKRKKDLPKALAAYKRLNQLAMQLLGPEGILVSCSCSYHVSAEDLQDAIAKAATGSGQAAADPGNGRTGAGSSGASRPFPRPVISKPISVGSTTV